MTVERPDEPRVVYVNPDQVAMLTWEHREKGPFWVHLKLADPEGKTLQNRNTGLMTMLLDEEEATDIIAHIRAGVYAPGPRLSGDPSHPPRSRP
jgi:hypothetical protein